MRILLLCVYFPTQVIWNMWKVITKSVVHGMVFKQYSLERKKKLGFALSPVFLYIFLKKILHFVQIIHRLCICFWGGLPKWYHLLICKHLSYKRLSQMRSFIESEYLSKKGHMEGQMFVIWILPFLRKLLWLHVRRAVPGGKKNLCVNVQAFP